VAVQTYRHGTDAVKRVVRAWRRQRSHSQWCRKVVLYRHRYRALDDL